MKDNCERDIYLKINNLSVEYQTNDNEMPAVRGVSLSMCKGEILALVGESGSGKSTLCRSVLRLFSANARITSGDIILDGMDITALSDRELDKIRGKKASMILQEPVTSLDPTLMIGRQITEIIHIHDRKITKEEAKDRAVALLNNAGIDNADMVYNAYPGQLSGGMCQRCVIAMALSSSPGLLIADEPTTALDVTIQAEILKLLVRIRDDNNMSILFVTHDLGVAAQITDRIAVMRDGEIVETGSAADIFRRPESPYTASLLESLPYNHMKEL